MFQRATNNSSASVTQRKRQTSRSSSIVPNDDLNHLLIYDECTRPCHYISDVFFNAASPLKSFCESTPNTGDPQDECEEGKLAGQTEDLGATCFLLLGLFPSRAHWSSTMQCLHKVDQRPREQEHSGRYAAITRLPVLST